MSLKKTQNKTNQPTKQNKPQSNCKFPWSASFFLPSFLQMMQLQRRPGELQLTIMAEATPSSASSGHPALQSRHLAGLIRKLLTCLATRTTPMLFPFPWDIYIHQKNSEQKKCHGNGFCPVFNQSTGFRKDIFSNKGRKVRTLAEQPILDNSKHYYSYRVQSVETKNEDKRISFGSLMKPFFI